MRRQRLLTLIALLTVGTAGGLFLQKAGRPTREHQAWTFVSDMRCLGGCTDSALLRVLQNGVPSSLVATGQLSGSKGQVFSIGRGSSKSCSTGATFDPSNLVRLSTFIAGGSGIWQKAGTAQPTTTTLAAAGFDGTLTATRADYGATAGGSDRGMLYQNINLPSAGTYTWSFYVQGNGSSGTLYFSAEASVNQDSSCAFVATGYTRCSITIAGLTAGTGAFVIGPDRLVFPAENASPAQSVYLWGAKVESGSSATTVLAGNNTLFNTVNANVACVETTGLLSESQSVLLLASPQAFDNAAWTKTSVVATADQAIAPDGSLTADKLVFTGASSITQGAVVAATTAGASVYLRAASGTVSTLSVALKNTTAVTTLQTTTPTLTTQWQRVTLSSLTGITSGNTLALTISGTGGENVYVWEGELTAWPIASSPFPSGTTTRAADTFAYGTYGLVNTNSSAYVCLTPQYTGNTPGSGSYILTSSDGAKMFLYSSNGDSNIYDSDGTNVLTVSAGYTAGVKRCYALHMTPTVRILQNLTDGWANAAPAWTSAFGSTTLNMLSPFDGWYTDLCAGPLGACYAKPAFVAAIGDSLTQGVETVDTAWPHQLQVSLNNNGWAIVNDGVSGNLVTDMQTRWTATIRPEKPGVVVFLGGINDVNAGTSAATIWANIKTLADQALADGATLHLVTLLPYGNNVNWTAGRQTVLTTVNTSILSYCTTNSLRCIDAYAGMGDVDPTKLKASYDHGDGLHLNSAGNAALAALVKAQL